MKGQIMVGSIQIYYGEGRGKTTAALGLGIKVASAGKQVIMIQFLRRKHSDTLEYLKRLEPELQVFRFDRAACGYTHLTEEERKEQLCNIKMALAYTKKVIDTAQCELLILDGIFGLVDFDIISVEELKELILKKDESMDIILTGRHLPDGLAEVADGIYSITTEKEEHMNALD